MSRSITNDFKKSEFLSARMNKLPYEIGNYDYDEW